MVHDEHKQADVVDLLAGDLSLITGTPETDPASPSANIAHGGQIIWQRGNAVLPGWVVGLGHPRFITKRLS
jgi:hypothetical protein